MIVFWIFAMYAAGGCAPKNPAVEEPELAVVRIDARHDQQATPSQCRGFIVSADGWLVTALHPVDGAQDITVIRNDGKKLFADFVQGDKAADLAILRVHAAQLPFLQFATDEDVEPGLHVRLLGSAGVVHGTFDHWESLGNFMAVTTPITPIDVGAPLISDHGQVVAIARESAKDAKTPTLATPVYHVLEMMPALAK